MVPKVLEPEVIQLFTISYCLNNISMLVTLFDVRNTVHALGSSKSSDFHQGRAPPYSPLPDLSERGGSHHLHPHTLPAVTRNTAPVGSLATGPPVPSCLPGKYQLLTRDLAQPAVLPDVALQR